MTYVSHTERYGVVRPLESTVTFKAWKLGKRESLPVVLDAPETIGEAVMQAMAGACWNRGDTLAVQYSHAGRDEHTLWQFTVKRSTKVGVWRAATDGGRKVFVGQLEPMMTSQVALAAPFAPVERFDAFKDDPTGFDPSLIDQAAKLRKAGAK